MPTSPQFAALLNQYGGGLIHMEIYPVAKPPPLTPEQKRRRRRFAMQVKQLMRVASGVLQAPTIVAAGTGYDLQAVDGLDVTVENDQDAVMIDGSVVASFSANPGIVRLGVFIDNAVDMTQLVDITWAVVTAAVFPFVFAPIVGPGAHRYRLYMTTTNAVTITLTAAQRRMRVATLLGQT
jgi:hypothetical protein